MCYCCSTNRVRFASVLESVQSENPLKNEFVSCFLLFFGHKAVEFHTITIKKNVVTFVFITKSVECMVHRNRMAVCGGSSVESIPKTNQRAKNKRNQNFHYNFECFCFCWISAFHLKEFIKCIDFSHAMYIQPHSTIQMCWESHGWMKMPKVKITMAIQFSGLGAYRNPILFI